MDDQPGIPTQGLRFDGDNVAFAACVFGPPAGGLPPDEPIIPLAAYSFSEPTLVLTNTARIMRSMTIPQDLP